MATGTLTIVGNVGGVTIQKVITETGDHPNVYGDSNTEIPLAAGSAVSNWVKTDADTAAGDLQPGHGFTTGKMDVFWDVGMRYDVDVTVTTNALALDGGVGDDFPATAEDTVFVAEVTQINTAIDGDNVQLLVINSTQRGSVYFEDAASASVKQIELLADNPYTYAQSSGEASPLTGNPIAVCFASNATATAGVLTILSLEDSTP